MDDILNSLEHIVEVITNIATASSSLRARNLKSWRRRRGREIGI